MFKTGGKLYVTTIFQEFIDAKKFSEKIVQDCKLSTQRLDFDHIERSPKGGDEVLASSN